MNLGLRAKSVLARCLCIGVISFLAWLAGAQALASIEANWGATFARNATQHSKQRVLSPVARELALRTNISALHITESPQNKSLTVSIGIAKHCFNNSLEKAIKRADLALYAAKRAGRDRVFLASESSD